MSDIKVSSRSTLTKVVMSDIKRTNPALKKSSNIPEIYAKIFGRFH